MFYRARSSPKKVAATALTPAQIVLNYRRLAQLITARKLSQAVSCDADDDHVLACAIAAQADLIVSGDEHLLTLKIHQNIPILTPAETLRCIEAQS